MCRFSSVYSFSSFVRFSLIIIHPPHTHHLTFSKRSARPTHRTHRIQHTHTQAPRSLCSSNSTKNHLIGQIRIQTKYKMYKTYFQLLELHEPSAPSSFISLSNSINSLSHTQLCMCFSTNQISSGLARRSSWTRKSVAYHHNKSLE